LRLQQGAQVHDETPDYLLVGAHQAIELRAITASDSCGRSGRVGKAPHVLVVA
jgi:hypothetical protein